MADRLETLRAAARKAILTNAANKREVIAEYRAFKAEIELLDKPFAEPDVPPNRPPRVDVPPHHDGHNRNHQRRYKTIKNLPKLPDTVAKNLTALDLIAHLDSLEYALAVENLSDNVAALKSNLIASAANCRPLCRHVLSISSNLSMDAFRSKVLEFLGPAITKQNLVQQLKELRQGSAESIANYADNFLTVIRALGSREADADVQARFLDGLHREATRSAVRTHLALAATMPAEIRRDVVTIEELKRLCMAVESGVSTASAVSATSNSSSSVSSSAKKKLGSGVGTPGTEPMWCYHHHSDSHRTSECRSLGKRGRDDRQPARDNPGPLGSSVAVSSNSSTSASNSSSVDPAGNPVRERRCFHCNQVGHLRNSCPVRQNGKRPRGTDEPMLNMSVTTMAPHPALFAASVVQDQTSQGSSDADTIELADDLITHVFLEDHGDSPVRSFLDTGASCSFIVRDLCYALKIHFRVDPKVITTESGSFEKAKFTSIGVTEPVLVRCGLHMKMIRFIVCEHLQRAPIYLGRPDLLHLKLITVTLPAPIIETMNLEKPKFHLMEYEVEQIDLMEDVRDEDRERHDTFLQRMEPLLAVNDKITGFAVAPEVTIDMHERVPKKITQYPIPHAHKEAVNNQVVKWLQRGKIRETVSNYNLPLTTADKHDSLGNVVGVRVCLDPRSINKNIIGDNFLIPHIRDIHESFVGCKYFGEIDLEDAFLQLKLCERDQKMLCFTWRGKQYSFVGAPYGVKIMSNVFQRTMSALFADLPFVRIYIDNICFGSRSWEEHEKHVELVLRRLNELNLKLSRKKMKIGRRSIRLLGREISEDGIRPDPVKVAKVMSWPFPSDCKSLQSFMGVVNYLGPHIRFLADIAAPLNKARDSQEAYDRQVALDKASMTSAFEQLKEAIAHLPLIRYPDFDRPFHVATDASVVGVGAVLYQPSPDQESVGDSSITSDNIVAIYSHSLKSSERNYHPYKLELLAVVKALKEFHCFLHGHSFVLHTDHRALVHVLDNSKTGPIRQTEAGWVQDVLSYNFVVEHVPGLMNLLPDHLSRMYSRTDAWGVDNVLASQRKKIIDLQNRMKDRALSHGQEVGDAPARSGEEFKQRFTASSSNAAESAAATPQIFLAPMDATDTSTRDELMRTLGKTIPPESERVGIIRSAHSKGHLGVKSVVERIYNHDKLWWPAMRRDVETELAKCSMCQKHNAHKRGYHPPHSPDVALPGDWWQMDLIHMQTSLNGFSYILVIVDLFTSYALTRALRTASAEEVASQLYQVMADWGPPKIIQSDDGTEFVNKVVQQLCEASGTTLKVSTPYYKHSTGSVERLNQTIEASLKKMLGGAIATWDTMLPVVTFFYNTAVRRLTGSSPYSLMFTRAYNNGFGVGEEPLVQDLESENFNLDEWLEHNDSDLWLSEHKDRLEDWIQHNKDVIELIYPSIKQRIQEQRAKEHAVYEKKHKTVQTLAVGTRVMHEDPKRTNKHDQRFVGPYKVQQQLPTGSYILRNDLGDEIRAPISALKVIPPDMDDNDAKIQEIERIIKHQGKGEHARYLVKWKNLPHSENSWLKVEDFEDLSIVTRYLSKHAPARQTKKKLLQEARRATGQTASSSNAQTAVGGGSQAFSRAGRHLKKKQRTD